MTQLAAPLMQAHNQWAKRPDDERFTSLDEMLAHFSKVRQESRALVVSNHRIALQPSETGLELVGANGHGYEPTHWSFGQLAALAEAPAGYLRTLPAPMAADCVNYGLRFKRSAEDIGVLLQKNGSCTLRCATGPRYGRIWNEDIVRSMVERFGDGVTGQWTVPGEFGVTLDQVTKRNTTLFASDRDMFVFLADEKNRIEIANRRDGQKGSLARGFFVWNSEVGAATFGLGCFLFDYVCCNRMIWGASQYKEIKIRHTVSAPDRFIEEITPALCSYANDSSQRVIDTVKAAQAQKLDDLDEFLGKRFGKGMIEPIKTAHILEEHRPIETRFDVITAATAYARGIKHQDRRVELERLAGDLF